MDFDGDEYVNVPNVALSNSAFTLESYIKAKSASKDGALVSTNNITVLAKANGAFTNKYNISVTFQNNGKTEMLTALTNLDIDKWYHIAIVQDVIQNGKTTVRVLIDGVQVTMKKDIAPIAFANDLKNTSEELQNQDEIEESPIVINYQSLLMDENTSIEVLELMHKINQDLINRKKQEVVENGIEKLD